MFPEFGRTLANLLQDLGDIPLWRIPLRPAPGKAKERDVIAFRRTPERWLCELVDDTIVLKPPGTIQSVLSGALSTAIMNHAEAHDLGVGLAASAMYRLKPGLVRIPDFSFLTWSRLPGGQLPHVEIADLVPDLVTECPRPDNTEAEMARKIREYLEAGVHLVWVVHYPQQTAEVYAPDAEPQRLRMDEAFDGGDVLPGLRVPLSALFARLRRKEIP